MLKYGKPLIVLHYMVINMNDEDKIKLINKKLHEKIKNYFLNNNTMTLDDYAIIVNQVLEELKIKKVI